jgi:hypothetical protein
VLPAAISVRIAREVLREAASTRTWSRWPWSRPETTQEARPRPARSKSIDYTGGSTFGRWLLDHAAASRSTPSSPASTTW